MILAEANIISILTAVTWYQAFLGVFIETFLSFRYSVYGELFQELRQALHWYLNSRFPSDVSTILFLDPFNYPLNINLKSIGSFFGLIIFEYCLLNVYRCQMK